MNRPDDEFFVGYLPMPPRARRFAIAVAAGALGVSAAVAVLAASVQRTPGAGLERPEYSWEQTGVLIEAPYPMLQTTADGVTRHTLLVRGGKNGVPRREDLVGRAVRVRGGSFSRDGRTLAEVYELEPIDGSPAPPQSLEEKTLQRTTLTGRIVDSKCYYGRMRPGEGRIHRACAEYCIDSGIPALLITMAADGTPTHYLLASREGGAIHQRLLPYVAERVEVSGVLKQRGDVLTLWIDGDPKRL